MIATRTQLFQPPRTTVLATTDDTHAVPEPEGVAFLVAMVLITNTWTIVVSSRSNGPRSVRDAARLDTHLR